MFLKLNLREPSRKQEWELHAEARACRLWQMCWKGTNCSAASRPSALQWSLTLSFVGELNFTPHFRNSCLLEGLQHHSYGPRSTTRKSSVLRLSQKDGVDKCHKFWEEGVRVQNLQTHLCAVQLEGVQERVRASCSYFHEQFHGNKTLWLSKSICQITASPSLVTPEKGHFCFAREANEGRAGRAGLHPSPLEPRSPLRTSWTTAAERKKCGLPLLKHWQHITVYNWNFCCGLLPMTA